MHKYACTLPVKCVFVCMCMCVLHVYVCVPCVCTYVYVCLCVLCTVITPAHVFQLSSTMPAILLDNSVSDKDGIVHCTQFGALAKNHWFYAMLTWSVKLLSGQGG